MKLYTPYDIYDPPRLKRDGDQDERPVSVRIEDRDVEWFFASRRHGGRLPTSYYHAFTAPEFPSYQVSQRRLMKLARARDAKDRKYIIRPDEQFDTKDPEWNDLISEVGPAADAVLEERGLWSPYFPTMRGSFKHQVMGNCISASFELNCRGSEYTFKPQHVFCEQAGKGIAMGVEGTAVVPDGLFGLVSNKELDLFREEDRGTEPLRSQKPDVRDIDGMIDDYKIIIGKELYKQHFKTDARAMLLITTISATRANAILELIERKFPKGCSYIAVHFIPEFARKYFHPPKQLNMLTTPWRRVGYPVFQLARG